MAVAELVLGWALGTGTGAVGGWVRYVRQHNDDSLRESRGAVRAYLAAVLNLTSTARLFAGMDQVQPASDEVVSQAVQTLNRALADALLLVQAEKVIARLGLLNVLVQERVVPLLLEGASRGQWEAALEAVRPHQVELVQEFRRGM